MTTDIINLCDGLIVASAPTLTTHARVIVRTTEANPGLSCDPALAVLRDVNRSCSRFNPESELRKLNADPGAWHVVGQTCSKVLREAWWAYRRTSGEYDPRMSGALRDERPPWEPGFAERPCRVHLGGLPVDLDGIGRGLVLRWAGLALGGTQHLVEVGDASWCSGLGPDGTPWRIGLPDPLGDPSPLAVLSLTDTACVTSTLSRARIGGQRAIDGLLGVTVVGADAVAAEVWSTVLLATPHIDDVVVRHRLPAAWVTEDGKLHTSPALESKLLWRR